MGKKWARIYVDCRMYAGGRHNLFSESIEQSCLCPFFIFEHAAGDRSLRTLKHIKVSKCEVGRTQTHCTDFSVFQPNTKSRTLLKESVSARLLHNL